MVCICFQVSITIFEPQSLKEKRSIIKSIIEKIKIKYNVSVIESGDNDFWQKGKIGFSVCSTDYKNGRIICNKICNCIEKNPYVEILNMEEDHIYI